MRARLWIVLLAAVALGGCGGEEPTLSASSAEQLHAQVAEVRDAAAEGDRAAALKGLDGLAARVRDLEAEESLAASDATALRRGIARARRQVRAEIAEPAATATATPVPTATAPPEAPEGEEDGESGTGDDEQKGKGEAQGKGKGKAKGKRGEEGDD
jgi:hypothetical protein